MRRMVIASVGSNKKNAIHCLSEVDVSKAMHFRQKYSERNGIKPSVTAYIVRCFAEAIGEHPEMNSFIRGRNLILLHDINISVMIEREIDGTKVPEPVVIRNANQKAVMHIHREISEARANPENRLGSLNNMGWINHIPGRLFKSFVKLADRNIAMAKRYGKLAVTAVGMHSGPSSWFIPHGTATVMLTVGSLAKKNILSEEGKTSPATFLKVTGSFDHEIIDGAPAARFMSRFEEILAGGELLNAD